MAGVLLGLGALVVLLASAARSAAAATPAAAAALPPATKAKAAVKKLIDSKNPRKLAAAAVVAHRAGDPALAQHLAAHARNAAATAPGQIYQSPIPGIAPAAWSAFVSAMRGPDAKAITPTYFLGLFRFGMRRLVDLGLAHSPHHREHNGRQVWDATWVPALQPGPEKFLNNPDLQLKTFGRSMLSYAHQIATSAPQLVGSLLDGQPVTLSGLLGVAHQAGLQGLQQWAADAKVRARFPQTMAVYRRVNGIF